MRRVRGVGEQVAALPVVPVLAVLVALQLAQAFWFAFHTPHNGWIWYSGGDSTEYWSEQWAIAHGIIPQAVVGFGLPVYYAWVPLVTGTTLISGAAVIVLFQAIVLVPLALVLCWLVADRLFGRVYAWSVAALWVAGPLLLLHGFVPRYHSVFDQLFLVPHWFGFTNMADLPSLVAVLATAWLTLRWFDTGSPTDAVLGGLCAGLAVGIKPANGFMFPALVVLLVASRRPRQVALWFAALVPALLTLLLWKYRGLGNVPLTTSSYERLHVAVAPTLALTPSKYVQFNWHHFTQELIDLREVFWSLRFIEFLVIAGAFGVLRKRPVRGLFVVLWFASYGILKGSNVKSDFTSANWFRLTEPGLPAFIMLTAGVFFCLPVLGRTVRSARAVVADRLDYNRRTVAIAAVPLALIPLAVMLVAQPASSMRLARDNEHVNEAPLSEAFHLRADKIGKAVHLTWDKPSSGKTVPVFQIYRDSTGDGCEAPKSGSTECLLDQEITYLGPVTGTSFVDPHPGAGPQAYRVGMLAFYKRDVLGGDLMLLSRAIRVR